jgi:exonuclease III
MFDCHVCAPVAVSPQELPEVWLVNVYTPNSGEGLKRLDYRTQQWDKALAGYVKVGHTANTARV